MTVSIVPSAVSVSRNSTSVVGSLEKSTPWAIAYGCLQAGVTPLTGTTAQQGREIATRGRLDLAIVDLLLPDGDGLSVAFELLRTWPRLQIVLMTGTELSPDEAAICQRQDFPVLRKPFLAEDVVRIIQPYLLQWPRRTGGRPGESPHASAVGG